VIAQRVAAASCLALIVAACQSSPPTESPRTTDGASLPGGFPSAEPPVTLGPPPSPTPPDETSPVALDPTVLAFLPESVAGMPVTESVDEATQALADASLPTIASAVDAGVAVDAGNGNLVYAWVVRVRPDKFSDVIYGQWRDSYDEGACSGAGGVVRRAEATIAGRTVYITSCVQGLRTYHVWLKDQGILISASAIGDGKFGELLMANLRVPAPVSS
jgi:hypothetical protein